MVAACGATFDVHAGHILFTPNPRSERFCCPKLARLHRLPAKCCLQARRLPLRIPRAQFCVLLRLPFLLAPQHYHCRGQRGDLGTIARRLGGVKIGRASAPGRSSPVPQTWFTMVASTATMPRWQTALHMTSVRLACCATTLTFMSPADTH